MAQPQDSGSKKIVIIWTLIAVFFVALLFARMVYPEVTWASVTAGVALLACFGALLVENRNALKSRSVIYGANSTITTLLVVAIVCVLNFFSFRYNTKWDLTKNKLNTLSEQTVKLVKGLQKPVKATLWGGVAQKEQFRPLLENYKNLNSKFEVEYTDPSKDPVRATRSSIRTLGTLQLSYNGKESKIESLTEEKLTNELIKLTKEKSSTICATTGHGEKSFGASDPQGYSEVKKLLTNQSYEVKDVELTQGDKALEGCTAVAINGLTKPFVEREITTLRNYLDNGGRALIALDLDVKGGDPATELAPLLAEWNIKSEPALIVDQANFIGEPSFPATKDMNFDHAIMKDFKGGAVGFPIARPVELTSGAPAEWKTAWLAKTSSASIAITDLKKLGSGAVKLTGGEKKGPFNLAVAVEGNKKNVSAGRKTRLVVFGSSGFAVNQFARLLFNFDLYANAASWLAEDESVISIRAKEDEAARLDLTGKQIGLVQFMTMFVLPFLIVVAGVVIWFRRRKL